MSQKHEMIEMCAGISGDFCALINTLQRSWSNKAGPLELHSAFNYPVTAPDVSRFPRGKEGQDLALYVLAKRVCCCNCTQWARNHCPTQGAALTLLLFSFLMDKMTGFQSYELQ